MNRPPSDPPRRRAAQALGCLLFGLWLAACGGGGGGSSGDAPAAALPALGPGESAYDDPAAYSSAGSASLPGAVEGAAVTRHTLLLGGRSIAYTARAGHLIARDPVSGAAEAAMFYVEYSADGAAAAERPVTFFYNGGPGSASAWLHLGSFGPKRLATGVPSTSGTSAFPLVDNAETLLDSTDLVFVDAAGTGLSQAIAPYRNASFWGVDSDAALFRDFVVRWLQANDRAASPRFLYGESYGGPRTAVLARRLQEAGVAVDGLVLQSPALDYNSNCGLISSGNCGSSLPTYAAIGAWHGLASPRPADLDAYMGELRGFTAERYSPAIAALLAGTAPPADLPPLLAGYTGLPASQWLAQFNLQPATFRNSLLAGQVIGRYDGRMAAPYGTALAAEGDPSSTFLTAGFASAITGYLRDTLRYSNRSTYVMLSGAIYGWDFRHGGRELPDTVPDLAAVLAANPRARLLAMNGYHDLATPFRTTELDLARLGADTTRVQLRNYAGGHLTYLDDAARVRQRADLAAFYGAVLAAGPARGERAFALQAHAGRPRPDRAGTVPATPQPVVPQAAMQSPLRDPWLPPKR